ncbi:hypothetical protein RSAG8_01374, partial [Rhizoctonia solani AG-8 WAC10335]
MSEKADISNELPCDGRPAVLQEDDGSEPSSQDRTPEVDPTEGAPWRWRIIAMLFALSLAVGSSFSEATLGPLKSTLVKDLHISNARYGTISSATSVVNMCLPIVGGYLVDFYPIEYGMLFCAFSVFAGAIVSAVGAQHNAFGPVLGGCLLLGFGSTIIEIIPQKIYCHWFRGRGLAFVLGLDVSWGKVIVLIAKATAVPMSKVGGEWPWALWIPAIVCGANIVLTFAYMAWIRTLPQKYRAGRRKVSAQERARSQLRRPTLKAAREIPSFFWFMFCTQICQAGVVGGFNGLSADIIRATRGTTAQVAGYQGEANPRFNYVGAFILIWFHLTTSRLHPRSSFSEATLGPLKSTLVKDLHISNARYGTISSATSVVNMCLPIVGGYLVDFYPIKYGMLFCAFSVFAGAIVSAVGAQHNAFGPVLGGRLLMGFGSTIIEIIPQKIYCHWFRGRGLAFVLGLDVRPRTGRQLGQSYRANRKGYGSSDEQGWGRVALGSLDSRDRLWGEYRPDLCIHGVDTHTPTESSHVVSAGESKVAVASADPQGRARNSVFLLVHVLHTDLSGRRGRRIQWLERRYNSSYPRHYRASRWVPGQQVIPIFLSPFLGAFFDRYGRRMLFISITSCIWIMVFAVLGFSTVNALFPMVFSSVALSFNAMPFVCSVPILVASQDQIGTGYGLYKAFNNAGSVIIDVAAGAIQDKTTGGGYNGVIAFFIALKSIEIFWGSIYGVLDRRLLRGVLSMSEKERLEMEKKVDLNAEPGRRPVKAWTYGGWAFLGASIIIALVLFIKYSI